MVQHEGAAHTTLLPEHPDAHAANELRRMAELVDAGLAAWRPDPTSGAILDAAIGGLRCILIPLAPEPRNLSSREAQIARLVARGLTNRAIASALDISLWTVSSHLRRILAKLDVNSRAEMVAMVYWAASG
jgi:DNA-binding CsgD family transcriptional regulator